MHAHRAPLLLAAFALTATLPVAVLVDSGGEPAAPPRSVLVGAWPPAPGTPRFGAELSSAGALDSRAAPAGLAPADDRDAEIQRLRVALVASAEEIDRLTTALRDRDALWQARLDRDRLDDDLHQMLRREFQDIVALEDPNADDSVEDELVSVLLQVAGWLGPETIEVDGVELPGPRVTLADVRARVSDGALRRCAGRLPSWNLQLALTPWPGTWCTSDEDGSRSGCTLLTTREIGGEVVTVDEVRVEHDDPRVDAAREAYERVEQRRARDLEAVLGMPAGVLE